MISGKITVRMARSEDREALIGIKRRASLAVETGEVLQHLLDEPGHLDVDNELLASGQVIVAECNRAPVGFGSFLVAGSDVADLEGLFVEPSYWRRGIGQRILRAVERELVARQATSIRVVVALSAMPFYRSAGFTVIGEEKTQLGPLAPVMAKALSCPSQMKKGTSS